ncbi:MAG: MBOAT family O-acyltransferase [Myxococcota bacterium]
MSFVSTEFVAFLAVALGTFFLLPDRWRNIWLLVCSCWFYAHWSVRYLFLLLGTMTLDYFAALLLERAQAPRTRKLVLWMSVATNLGVLFTFKYFNLFSELVANVAGARPLSLELILPFGISFYTFHAMSYTIDVYRGVIRAQRNFVHYACFVLFFPQLVAGPIARARHLLGQFALPKRLTFENICDGSCLVARGYVQKMLLADHLAPVVDAYFGDEVAKTPFLVVQAVYFFAFQIYFDFSGYSDIARGVARWFDYDLTINFNRPYIAASVTEFWRRWHISLSTWLRDYLYISLGGNRHGAWRTYRNLLITMLLGGLWHGGAWTFLLWGGYHGVLLCGERLLGINGGVVAGAARPWWRVLITFHLVLISWVFFRADSFAQATEILEYCAFFLAEPEISVGAVQGSLWLGIAAFLSFEALEERWGLLQRYARWGWGWKLATQLLLLTTVVIFKQDNPKAFIYFQF